MSISNALRQVKLKFIQNDKIDHWLTPTIGHLLFCMAPNDREILLNGLMLVTCYEM